MTLSIRPMRSDADEIDWLARLRLDTFFKGGSRTLHDERNGLAQLARAEDEEIGLVAEWNGTRAGTCLLVRRELDQAHEVGPWLAGLVVEPGFRQKGIGTALVRAIETHARGRGKAELFLYTGAAEPFYAALGWETRDRFLENDGSDGVLMMRDFR